MPLTDRAKERANLNRARQILITIGRLQVTRCKANDNVLLSSNLTPTGGFHTSSTTHLLLHGSRAHSCTLHLYFVLPAQLFADPYELDH